MILTSDVQYRPVLCGWFAIWFANFRHQPMSAFEGKADIPDPLTKCPLMTQRRHLRLTH
jgi:hypothetical protein